MRIVRYEYNGQEYKTLAEAPKDAKAILIYKNTEPSPAQILLQSARTD